MTKRLLFSLTKDDFEVQTFRAGGKGGQHQNKRETGVRIIHRASGAVAESREERSQLQNKRAAFTRLVQSDKFKSWHRVRSAYALRGVIDFEREVERQVDEWMRPECLKVETFAP